MRSAKEDIALIQRAGFWGDERDPVFNAVVLLCLYAKRRHKPVRNLHKLAEAIENGDLLKAGMCYHRLRLEVEQTLRKYPDIEGTLATMLEMSDEQMAQIDRLMEEQDGTGP